MANHKKRRPISARGHCKMCKRWKINGIAITREFAERWSDHKRRTWADREIKESL